MDVPHEHGTDYRAKTQVVTRSLSNVNICSLEFIIVSLIPLTSGQLVISALKGFYLCIWQGAWASSLDNYWLLILMIPLIKLPAASWRVFLVRRIWTVDKCKEREILHAAKIDYCQCCELELWFVLTTVHDTPL